MGVINKVLTLVSQYSLWGFSQLGKNPMPKGIPYPRSIHAFESPFPTISPHMGGPCNTLVLFPQFWSYIYADMAMG